jgi:hypothetical protein
MRKLLALLLIASMPLTGVAQSLAPVTSSALQNPATQPVIDDHNGPVNFGAIPLWGTPDGRILAMISAGAAAYPTLPKSPQIAGATEWRLIDVTNAVSASVLANINDRSLAHIDLSRSNLLAPALSAGAQCANGDAACAGAALAQTGALRLGIDWLATDNLSIDLSYGLSWLHRNSELPGDRTIPVYDSLVGIGNPALPNLVIPGVDLSNAQSSSVNALGRLHLNETQALDFGASLSRIQLSIPGGAPLTSLNQAAVSFGLEYGPFTGTLTGHVLGPNEMVGPANGNPHLTGLDVGLSWRTPWRGMFSVGAQNLWSTGSLPLAAPIAHDADPSQARVPYVQYHQDL